MGIETPEFELQVTHPRSKLKTAPPPPAIGITTGPVFTLS